MNFDDYHKKAKARGDGMLPELEQLMHSAGPLDPTGQTILELRLISEAHAMAAGSVAVGRVTEDNNHNVVSFKAGKDNDDDRQSGVAR